MANGVYEININVNGAPSGSGTSGIPKQQVQPQISAIGRGATPEERQLLRQQALRDVTESRLSRARQFVSNIEPPSQEVRRNASVAAGLGVAAYFSYVSTSAQIQGNSNKAQNLKNIQTGARYAGTVALAIVNPAIGVPALAIQAFQLSQENRKFIHDLQINSFKAEYYRGRLIQDTTKRSR